MPLIAVSIAVIAGSGEDEEVEEEEEEEEVASVSIDDFSSVKWASPVATPAKSDCSNFADLASNRPNTSPIIGKYSVSPRPFVSDTERHSLRNASSCWRSSSSCFR